MTNRKEQTELRKKHDLPYRCECGGIMEYAFDFGRVWSACKSCTPVVKIDVSKLRPTQTARTAGE